MLKLEGRMRGRLEIDYAMSTALVLRAWMIRQNARKKFPSSISDMKLL
jgi:hypothetical protein